MFLKLLSFVLLKNKKQYIKAVKMKNRNVLITIEEYIPTHEIIRKTK